MLKANFEFFVHEIESIKRCFKPIQPSVKLDAGEISYQEFKPSQNLENYIYCYWQLKTNEKLEEPFKYRVVSDSCIDIFFELKEPDYNFIMGFCRKYTTFEIGQDFNYFGIRFLPSFFPLFFKIDAKTIANRTQDLELILPAMSKWISSIKQGKDLIRQCDNKLESIIQLSEQSIDERFYNAIYSILNRQGNLDVEKELTTGLSARQLRRKFNYYLGTTPKAFANVVRFQHILNIKPSKQSLKENKIYFDVGFYDQAHFIKSFKTFYGVTPSVAFD